MRKSGRGHEHGPHAGQESLVLGIRQLPTSPLQTAPSLLPELMRTPVLLSLLQRAEQDSCFRLLCPLRHGGKPFICQPQKPSMTTHKTN